MNQKFKDALSELGAEYNLSHRDVVRMLQAAESDWLPIEDCPKYERHKETGVIRNRNTHRVLKPNNSGYVKVRNTKGEIVAMKQSES
ncbi:TPA: hypothetical protein NKT21_004083 [Vibrio parahaemolyticus]|uniref:hypothetical protein n=1 Tax=Vibrio sp. Isolate24 TaxID=2908534 RepID=UPI001EFE7AB6|nr:hypothetical protein [Vibrio sp. Isolate24]MCG9680482.1 hypothetical protein [Vibrio sp. Isolate24]HCH2844792.1 hypothetical protein [Vibrio parahaemolyticus]